MCRTVEHRLNTQQRAELGATFCFNKPAFEIIHVPPVFCAWCVTGLCIQMGHSGIYGVAVSCVDQHVCHTELVAFASYLYSYS